MEIMVVILVETRTLYAKSAIYLVMELTNTKICLIMHLFQSKKEVIKEDSGLEVVTFFVEIMEEVVAEALMEDFLDVSTFKAMLLISHH